MGNSPSQSLSPTYPTSRWAGLPDDCLAEILKLVDGFDLLSIERCCLYLSLFLRDPSSTFIWRAVIRNGTALCLPPCPPDLGPRHYIHLAFGCFCLETSTTYWMLRTRLCSKCKKTLIKRCNKRNPPQLWFVQDRDISFEDLVRTRPSSHRRQIEYLRSEIIHIRVSIATKTDREQKQWLGERKSSVKAILDHALQTSMFEAHLRDRREIIMKARAVLIRKKLFTLGWGEWIQTMPASEFDDHPLVRLPAPLTPTEWQEIRAPLEGYMEEIKERLAVEHQEELRREEARRYKEAQASLDRWQNPNKKQKKKKNPSGFV
ncbi:F-box domain-containing protein [Mycena indigotica]|uniref:F-box domain-containing protein n=1 Tax=Mycena indigotica TaxID=2126181 RepID=A0A8H6SY04_9AGAR|nr:F-box domain-containing protein [Mycena indigotica]KAF7307429.1 F-box domain-containing protein [Mycena indigotica]